MTRFAFAARSFLSGVAVLMLFAVASGTDAYTPAASRTVSVRVKDEILTLAREQNAAIKNHDRTALERIYAPEFFMVHAYGYVDSRAEHIDQLLARDATDLIPLPTFTPPEELNVYGDVAVHRYTAHFGRSSFRGPLPPDLALELARQIAASFAISPDGRRMAFVAERDGQPTLWVRDLDLRE